MPFQAETRVVGLHPDAVVFDSDELLAAVLDGDDETPGVGVDGVLDQFLDDRGGTLDDLTRGNLVGEVVWQSPDAAHLSIAVQRGRSFNLRPLLTALPVRPPVWPLVRGTE